MSSASTALPIELKTPLSAAITVAAFTLEHSLGRPYRAELTLICDDPNLDFEQLVGQEAAVEIRLPSGGMRHLKGYISDFELCGINEESHAICTVTVVPWIWLLSRNRSCQIFQNLTAPEIIEQVFLKAGFNGRSDRSNLTEEYPVLAMTVQYNESDLDFVSRLMERYGIYYYIEQAEEEPTVYLCDSPSAYRSFPDYDALFYQTKSEYLATGEYISQWILRRAVEAGTVALTDYDYLQPKSQLHCTAIADPPNAYSQFHYPGHYFSSSTGELIANARLDQNANRAECVRGQSNALGLTTGYQVRMRGHPRESQNDCDFLVTSQKLVVTAGSLTRDARSSGYQCSGEFTAIPASQFFRPPMVTPCPRIEGCQTAIVWGPPGWDATRPFSSELSPETDGASGVQPNSLGSVNLLFPWDLNAKDDPDRCPTPPIRLAQPSAGSGMGAVFIPLVGTEVVVSFRDGNPDRPLVTGRVYNGDQTPPFSLPTDDRRSGFQDQFGNRIYFTPPTPSTNNRPTIHLEAGDAGTYPTSSDASSDSSGGSKSTGTQITMGFDGFVHKTEGSSTETVVGDKITNVFGLNLNNYVGLAMSDYFGMYMTVVSPLKGQFVLGREYQMTIGNWSGSTDAKDVSGSTIVKAEFYAGDLYKFFTGKETKGGDGKESLYKRVSTYVAESAKMTATMLTEDVPGAITRAAGGTYTLAATTFNSMFAAEKTETVAGANVSTSGDDMRNSGLSQENTGDKDVNAGNITENAGVIENNAGLIMLD